MTLPMPIQRPAVTTLPTAVRSSTCSMWPFGVDHTTSVGC